MEDVEERSRTGLGSSFYRGARARRARARKGGSIRQKQAGQDENRTRQDKEIRERRDQGKTMVSRMCVLVAVRAIHHQSGGPTLSLVRNCEIASHGGTTETPIRCDYYCFSTWKNLQITCYFLRCSFKLFLKE